MASKDKDSAPDLKDVVLYAPIGFLYEYRKVMPQLVKKGRSQVQLGMFLGRMAASRGGAGAEKATADVLSTVATVAARGITEFGQAIGLAPPEDEAPPVAAELVVPLVPEIPPAPPKAKDAVLPKPATAPEPPGRESLSRQKRVEATKPKKKSGSKKKSSRKSSPKKSAASTESAAAPRPRLPIAGYDDLTAREIISLLDDLTDAQRKRVRQHELENRNRKTIAAKLDRLES